METKLSNSLYSVLTDECKKHEEITEEIPLINESNKPHETKHKEIKEENFFPDTEVKDSHILKALKAEEEQGSKLCDELKTPEQIKKEKLLASPISKRSQEFTEIDFLKTTQENVASYSEQQVDKPNINDILEPPNQVKVEQFWPDDDDNEEDPCCSDGPLVINWNPPDFTPLDYKKETDCELTSLPEVVENEMEMEPLQQPCPAKQEPVDSSDDDISVDYLIDNFDFIKKEMKEGSVSNSACTEEPNPTVQEEIVGAKQEMESTLVIAGTKAKSQGKRVTWNIQEPEGPQPEKMSKLALFKLKLKQEGCRKAAASQSSGQEAAPAQALNLYPPAQGGAKTHREELFQDPHHKDKYMKKLHMQERAIEEVKLAIKPFYQKRDITKEEYKEILRKAVQKVCHSKSGEINPIKVANLVKAYVEKYKHSRKHRKGENSREQQSAEVSKTSEASD